MPQAAPQAGNDWRALFREIHREKGLVAAIQYLRQAGINPSDLRALLEQEKAAGRIAKLPDS